MIEDRYKILVQVELGSINCYYDTGSRPYTDQSRGSMVHQVLECSLLFDYLQSFSFFSLLDLSVSGEVKVPLGVGYLRENYVYTKNSQYKIT